MVNLNCMFLHDEIASQTVGAYPHYAHRYAIVIDFTKSACEYSSHEIEIWPVYGQHIS